VCQTFKLQGLAYSATRSRELALAPLWSPSRLPLTSWREVVRALAKIGFIQLDNEEATLYCDETEGLWSFHATRR